MSLADVMKIALFLFPAFGMALVYKQIRQGYVIGGNWKPWFYRDTQPLGFWAVIAWGVLWTIFGTVIVMAI